ncbi:MAG: Fe-S-containing hydro-lyase [Bacilli bacterium]
MEKHLSTPLTYDKIKDLKMGDFILLSGIIYTARDAAHARFIDLINEGKELPFDIKGSVIYYVGPTPTKPGQIIGSCGPTTSYRMDAYSPLLIEKGLRGMIGKGKRSKEVTDSMKQHGAIYLAGIGGAAAITADCVVSQEMICYEDLQAEAVRKLEVKNMPLIVAIDINGNDIFAR